MDRTLAASLLQVRASGQRVGLRRQRCRATRPDASVFQFHFNRRAVHGDTLPPKRVIAGAQTDVLQSNVATTRDQWCHDVCGRESVLFREGKHLKSAEDLTLDFGPQGGGFGRASGAEAQLKYRDRADKMAVRTFSVEPTQHLRVGEALDQLTDDVGVKEEHGPSIQFDGPVQHWDSPQAADFLQRREESMVCVTAFFVAPGSGTGLRIADNSAERFLNEGRQRLAFPPGLALGQIQETFIHIHYHLHAGRLGLPFRSVNCHCLVRGDLRRLLGWRWLSVVRDPLEGLACDLGLVDLASWRRAAMEGPGCRGSSSSTSSRTEVSTAVTIANQPQVIIRVCSGGQNTAPAPFLEDVRLNLSPGDQGARLVPQFEHVAGLKSELFSEFAGNFDLTVLSQNRVHKRNVRGRRS